ncbi:hypothetical protein ASPWEDRAFT_25986 [Aspergillus wentii DTO 134E9]|uniref:Uncharacterized protein n=1 Tax=Aspergillus wentii DTO 134E9 TaxID=1073089 RepID=A0A1L9RNN2_ASPWE|nr:uncharacterized protein ASPWEDRAFT_25986 [Aspergillus wentii DTO 134E9]OJJ36524.1 hypothetical protein ASPWEDRAFT_25986 [Aspergillus wentii DTO 134E9]
MLVLSGNLNGKSQRPKSRPSKPSREGVGLANGRPVCLDIHESGSIKKPLEALGWPGTGSVEFWIRRLGARKAFSAIPPMGYCRLKAILVAFLPWDWHRKHSGKCAAETGRIPVLSPWIEDRDLRSGDRQSLIESRDLVCPFDQRTTPGTKTTGGLTLKREI